MLGVVFLSVCLSSVPVNEIKVNEITKVETPVAADSEIRFVSGVYVGGYAYSGGVLANTFLTTGASGRLNLRLGSGGAKQLVFEGGAVGFIPAAWREVMSGGSGTLRAGIAWHQFSVSAGAYLHVDRTPKPLQVLPSVLATWRPSWFSIALGVLDRPVGPLARLSFETKYWGLGYAAPYGAHAYARLPITPAFAVELEAFGYAVLNSFNTGAGLTFVYRPAAGRGGS